MAESLSLQSNTHTKSESHRPTCGSFGYTPVALHDSKRAIEKYIVAERIKIAGWDNREVNILQLVNTWLCDEANG